MPFAVCCYYRQHQDRDNWLAADFSYRSPLLPDTNSSSAPRGDPHPRSLAARAGYCSKNFDTDTLSSILVPERYFFRYQFYEISFNKITLSQKTLVLFFQLVDIYTDSKTHHLSRCTKEQNISNTINQCK